MPPITKASIKAAHEQEGKRICFGLYDAQLPRQEDGSKGFVGKLSWPYTRAMERVFPYGLFPNRFKPGRVWRSIKQQEELTEIQGWCDSRKKFVYLADCLSASAALGFNKPSNETAEYTEVGSLVARAKTQEDTKAIERLLNLAQEFISMNPPFGEVDFIAAIPAPHKAYDLPTKIVDRLSEILGVANITKNFSFGGVKGHAKEIKADDPKWFDEKWKIWDGAQVKIEGVDLQGKTVLLIDDNYQSGLSMQYIAMILQRHGANQVFGLSMTKTLGDKAN